MGPVEFSGTIKGSPFMEAGGRWGKRRTPCVWCSIFLQKSSKAEGLFAAMAQEKISDPRKGKRGRMGKLRGSYHGKNRRSSGEYSPQGSVSEV